MLNGRVHRRARLRPVGELMVDAAFGTGGNTVKDGHKSRAPNGNYGPNRLKATYPQPAQKPIAVRDG